LSRVRVSEGEADVKRKARLIGPAFAAFVACSLLSDASAGGGHGGPEGARTIAPIVSAAWLEAHRSADDLVIVDIRPAAAYDAAHIPGSISEPFAVPFSAWITMRDDLLLELPDEEELFASIGALGIDEDSRVVIVTSPNPGEPPTYGLSNGTRVAGTLIYAGVPNVAVLDGGFGQWQAAGLPTTTELPSVTPVGYLGEVDTGLFVSRQYVEARVGRVRIIDARDAEVYFGTTTEPFAAQAGHIPSARSLPAPWVWHPEDGTYRDVDVLGQMAAGVIRRNKRDEVIVYCGVGGYSSTWVFLLTQVLGYQNVKFYDGAAQDWARSNDLIPYRWD
jgi:thiosulfate/3-mercaptopyruvate sulfurtransferase